MESALVISFYVYEDDVLLLLSQEIHFLFVLCETNSSKLHDNKLCYKNG